jgi:dolichyl-phosphate beta-glucosyltransferase
VQAYLAEQSYASEVIVVDDGSTDATQAVVREYATDQTRLVPLARNQGKGAAVREGLWREACGAYRVFFDADASTPIEEVEKLWPVFEAGADVVIGSRALPDSRVEIHQAWYRETMGRMNNVILRALGLTHFSDTQCGFKGFTADACVVIFPRQTINRFSFDVELLRIAARQGLRVKEVPVVWRNSTQTSLNPLTDSARMLWDLLVIRGRDLRGAYR